MAFYRLKFILLVSFCLAGCHGIKPGAYPEQSEIKKGPGLLTGHQGELTLLPPQETLNVKPLETSPDPQ